MTAFTSQYLTPNIPVNSPPTDSPPSPLNIPGAPTPVPEPPVGDDFPRWTDIVLDGIQEGYTLSELGEVKSPSGNQLTPSQVGRQIWVNLKTTAASGNARVHRLDKLVLTFFDRPAQEGEAPLHRDGNLDNVALSNLKWAPAESIPKPPRAPHGGPKRAKKRGRSTPKGSRVHRQPVERQPEPPTPTVAPTFFSDSVVSDDVVVDRVYRAGELVVTVRPDGAVVLPKTEFFPAEAALLAKIMSRIQELNSFMGIQQ